MVLGGGGGGYLGGGGGGNGGGGNLGGRGRGGGGGILGGRSGGGCGFGSGCIVIIVASNAGFLVNSSCVNYAVSGPPKTSSRVQIITGVP